MSALPSPLKNSVARDKLHFLSDVGVILKVMYLGINFCSEGDCTW